MFAVKTNVAFDGSLDDDSPVHGSAVSFGIGDYLHVMERYDPNWWIGRKVQQDCQIGFIPSPAKLENLRLQVIMMTWWWLYLDFYCIFSRVCWFVNVQQTLDGLSDPARRIIKYNLLCNFNCVSFDVTMQELNENKQTPLLTNE